MSFIANTRSDRAIMLEALGLESTDRLFDEIPADRRFPKLELPPALSEPELLAELGRLAGRNAAGAGWSVFAGAGAYRHFIPAAVDALASRGEFLTAYTPYQPEASQGTLRALFEYQSLTAGLLGMQVVNASHYDGATALAEAVLMAVKATGRSKVLLSAGLHPDQAAVVESYTRELGIELVGPAGGAERPEVLAAGIDGETAAVAAAFPTFFGGLYDYRGLARAAHERGALFIAAVDPISLALFSPPGEWGADLVAAEGQCLGSPVSFGGPYLGILATNGQLVRRLPGRLAGMTVDQRGRPGYVLTLCTREQHIRREKATSNICTNQGLMALRAVIYLSLLGKHGLRRVAELCLTRARYAAAELARLPGFGVSAGGSGASQPFFKEFTLECPKPAALLIERLAEKKLVPGVALERWFPERKNELLVCVTELNGRAEIDALAAALKEAAR